MNMKSMAKIQLTLIVFSILCTYILGRNSKNVTIGLTTSSTTSSTSSQNSQLYGDSNQNITRETIMTRIFNNYNNHERPSESKQTKVIVYMKVLAINSVDVLKMEYSTDVLLRQEWTDERLAWIENPTLFVYNNSIVSPSLKEKVWLPDLFFRNGKKGFVHTMTLPNYLMRLKPNGEILYSQKITMRFSCQMNLSTFPMDTQECIMDIGSYGYTLDQLKFLWRNIDPIVIAENLQIPEFNPATSPTTKDCSEKASTTTGNYTCLKVSFHLERQLGSYLASTYIPNVLIVMVSWLNFWVSIEAIPARITLGLLTLLGILTQATGMSNSLPRVSYIKAIDIWIIACIIFVIGALIEFAMASMIARKRKSEDWQKQVREIVRQELARWCAVCQQQSSRPTNTNPQSVNALTNNQSTNSTALVQAQLSSTNVGVLPQPANALVQSGYDLSTHHPLSASVNVVGGGAGVAGGAGSGGGGGLTSATEDLEILLCPDTTAQKWKKKPLQKLQNSRSKSSQKNMDSEIDCYSRFLFPACFVLYNCFYWLYYLVLVGHH